LESDNPRRYFLRKVKLCDEVDSIEIKTANKAMIHDESEKSGKVDVSLLVQTLSRTRMTRDNHLPPRMYSSE